MELEHRFLKPTPHAIIADRVRGRGGFSLYHRNDLILGTFVIFFFLENSRRIIHIYRTHIIRRRPTRGRVLRLPIYIYTDMVHTYNIKTRPAIGRERVIYLISLRP